MQRYLWIDYVKSIGIFLIVYTHFPTHKLEANFISTFHVPLFFFVSGFLSAKKNHDLDINKKLERLLLPYIYIYLISVVISFMLKASGTYEFNILIFFKSIIGFLWGNHNFYPYFINAPLWFLPSLLTVELIFTAFYKKLPWFLLIFPLISLFLYTHKYVDIFMSIDLSLIGLNYYFFGHIFQNKGVVDIIQKRSIIGSFAIIFITFLIVLFLAINGNTWYTGNSVHAYAAGLLGGTAGCIMIITISLLLEKVLGEIKFIKYISQNTILILGFHLFLNRYTYKFISYTNFFPAKLKILAAAILSILLIIPIIMLINKFCPQIGGRNKKLAK